MAHVSLAGDWLEVNQRLCEMTGYSRDELLAASWQKITHPDDLPGNLSALSTLARGNHGSYSLEKRYIRKDGRVIWVKITVSPMWDETGKSPAYLITVIDEITEYKRAQELRRKAEEKCSKAFRQSPSAIMLINLRDRRFLEVNEAFERMTGYAREEVIGKTALELNLFVDPDLRQKIASTLMAGERVQEWEIRYRTKDGGIIDVLSDADLIEIDGEPCLIGTGLDITERKNLERELQELTGRLIEAQDEERKAISAELSDSLGQSVTVVSYEMSQLARQVEGDLVRDLQSLSAKIQDIATGIAIISQGLHPSGLDYTGLPWAVQGLCRQFTHVYGLQVAFKHESIPSLLPPDIALCLYRVVQEALRNVARHSGARRAWIELGSEGRSIRLEIWDKGVGFDPALAKAGVGLLTMRERCRRLNGRLEIRNQNGARIEVRIPLPDIEADLFDQPAAATLDVCKEEK